jgi:ATP-dependent DNA helicase RecQ
LPPEGSSVLRFKRAAALEVRRRLRALVGGDAAGVTVLTYHSMALRLTGMSLGRLAQVDREPDFDDVVRRAVDLLEGRVEAMICATGCSPATGLSWSTNIRTSMLSSTI